MLQLLWWKNKTKLANNRYQLVHYHISNENWKGTHFLYRILDSKKTSRSQFSVPDLREIHMNLKQQKNFNSRDGFLWKSPFCTFSCINPGFGRPWCTVLIFFVNGTFIMPQKMSFGQKFFWISCTGSRVPFWQKWKIANNPGFMQEKIQKGDFLKKPSQE